MPMTFLPPDDVLIAFGRMTLEFAELEYWINLGIIEGEHIVDSSERRRLTGAPFSQRVTRLEAALSTAETQGWIRFGEGTTPQVDFLPKLTEIGYERNDLIHGAAFALINWKTGVHHYKINLKTGSQRYLDTQTLDTLTATVHDCAERLQFAVMNLGLSKKPKGKGSITAL